MNEMDTRFANQYNIQWFPGHMTKTLRMMETEIQHVDASLVLLDARIPLSSLNPEIGAHYGPQAQALCAEQGRPGRPCCDRGVDQILPRRRCRLRGHQRQAEGRRQRGEGRH